MNKLYIADIVSNTVVDGPGFRTSVYTTGCEHACPLCHNKDTWELESGKVMSVDEIMTEIEKQPHNVTLTGGDPLLQLEGIITLAKKIKESGRDIWCYTGYTFEQVYASETLKEILNHIDVLVDGKYIEKYKDLSAIFRGSSNQRIVDVKKSMENNGDVVLYVYEPYPIF